MKASNICLHEDAFVWEELHSNSPQIFFEIVYTQELFIILFSSPRCSQSEFWSIYLSLSVVISCFYVFRAVCFQIMLGRDCSHRWGCSDVHLTCEHAAVGRLKGEGQHSIPKHWTTTNHLCALHLKVLITVRAQTNSDLRPPTDAHVRQGRNIPQET